MRFVSVLRALLALSVSAAVAADDWVPLYQRVDTELQAALDARIAAEPQWQRLARRKKLAVGLVDLGGASPRYARVNGNVMMYAASLPKIAILLGAYACFEDGSLEPTPEIMADLDAMIRVSSNSAATRVLDAVGMKKLEAILRDPRHGFYDEDRGGGLWVGKRYAKSGVRRGDPLYGISHGATVTQVARFYYLLDAGRLLGPGPSAAMLEHLVDPRLHHKFVSALDEVAPRAKVFRKSGTWRDWHSDSVLVRGVNWRHYILVAMVESPDGETILRELLPAAEELLNGPPLGIGVESGL